MLFTISAVATFLLPSFTVGYASAVSYTATTVCSGNSVTADYFTANLYSDAQCTVPKDHLLLSGNIEYTVTGTTYTIQNNTVISDASTYLKINSNHETDPNETDPYTISANFSCSLGNTPVNNATLTIQSGSTFSFVAGSATANISDDVAYPLTLKISNVSANLNAAPTILDVEITIMISDNISASYVGDKSITISGPIVINNNESAMISLEQINSNNESFSSGDYTFNEVTQGSTHGGQPSSSFAVEIRSRDQSGIAATDGSVNFTINVPGDTKFAVCCYSSTGSNGSIIITVNSKSATLTESSMSGSWAKIVVKKSSSYTDIEAYNQGNTRISNSSYWIPGGDDVNISLSGSGVGSNTKLEIWLWPVS